MIISDEFSKIDDAAFLVRAIKRFRVDGTFLDSSQRLADYMFSKEGRFGFASVTVRCQLWNASVDQKAPLSNLGAHYSWTTTSGEEFLAHLEAVLQHQEIYRSSAPHIVVCRWYATGKK